MKKMIKRGICLLLVLLLCFGISGCKELDRARAHHATLQEDGSLLLDGKTYLPLPYCPEFTPPMGMYPESVVVTEADVPVLLKDFFLDTVLMKSEDGRILGENGDYYCLEEDFESIVTRIVEGFHATNMRYTYYVYKEGDWDYASYVLTEEQKNTVRRVLASVEPRKSEENLSDYYITLDEASEDGWFSRFFCGIGKVGGRYMLFCDEDDMFKENMFVIYDVPSELNGIFSDIMADYIKAENEYVMVT